MPRCEDFPCCGHEPGDCPDAQGRFTCVDCRTTLPRNATSSLCKRCLTALRRDLYDPDREYRDY